MENIQLLMVLHDLLCIFSRSSPSVMYHSVLESFQPTVLILGGLEVICESVKTVIKEKKNLLRY